MLRGTAGGTVENGMTSTSQGGGAKHGTQNEEATQGQEETTGEEGGQEEGGEGRYRGGERRRPGRRGQTTEMEVIPGLGESQEEEVLLERPAKYYRRSQEPCRALQEHGG